MDSQNDVVVKGIVGAIRRLIRAVSIDTIKMSRQHSLTAPQSGVLRSLSRDGPLSSASLSRELCVTPSNITGIIDRLEKKGLVERTRMQGDRRVTLIFITEQGKQLSRDLPDPIEIRLISGLAELPPKKVKKLDDALKQIIDILDAKQIEDSPLR
ncbi:MAG: MarR family transcriptional regulator [Desulfobacterales bacterium]|jgi:DNA-binding MarR family transcriptional regulator